ncbi:preprotein translocase subunit SecY [Candidatus Micrarchaeota archaeon]|nr:preprotein translocase subunit SecY [Candidatus Micrarchaeota archaeon]
MGVIDIVHSFSKYLPAVKPPAKPLSTNDKLMWTGIALVLFFMMYNTTAYGVPHLSGSVDFLQTITASNIGSLLTTGIGPLVLSSIFLQLFVGAGLINLNLKDKKDKAKFLETQKVLAIILAIFEALVFVVFTHMVPIQPLFQDFGEAIIANPDGTQSIYAPYTMALVVLQIVLGSLLILFLDEIVSKYGIGSGISLFIAAGVSFAIFGGLIGLIFNSGGVLDSISTGGAEALPIAILVMLPFIFTILVFLAVVYAEGVKVEIPIAFQRVRGMVPKLPLKFFYVSNIPVIFASALIINIQLFAGGALTGQYWDAARNPTADFSAGYDFDEHGILPLIGYVDNDGRIRDGLLYLFTPLYSGRGHTMDQWNTISGQVTPILHIPEWVHAITYVITLSLVSIMFGLFWVETSNMDAKSVAGQLSDSGIQIPGFRRDPRMLETILNKHIFPLTVMGSFAVGLLAGLADLTGALGTGTGILLTVGILYRMYEQLEQTKALESNPTLNRLFGG